MSQSVLQVSDLEKTYGGGVHALNGVSLSVSEGETLAVVGESGCGKSTMARIILRLDRADAGSVCFGGEDLTNVSTRRMREIRRDLQFVPQDPSTSLNPRLTVEESIAFNLRAHGLSRSNRVARISQLLEQVGIPYGYRTRYPREMSGGQLQRVAIARALATAPRLVVCDEPVSSLDKSIQAQVINLLVELQANTGVAYLFISHDLPVVEHMSHRTVVMYLGRVVEQGPTAQLMQNPRHPYTRALLASSPGPERQRIRLAGEPPNPADLPSGCAFRPRCPLAGKDCEVETPRLIDVANGISAACVEYGGRRSANASQLDSRLPVVANPKARGA